jgi:hypothetical protein
MFVMAPSRKSWDDFSPTQWCINRFVDFNSSVRGKKKLLSLNCEYAGSKLRVKASKWLSWRSGGRLEITFLQTHYFKNCDCWLQLPVFGKKLLSLNFEDGGRRLCVTAAKCLLWLSRGSLELTFNLVQKSFCWLSNVEGVDFVWRLRNVCYVVIEASEPLM